MYSMYYMYIRCVCVYYMTLQDQPPKTELYHSVHSSLALCYNEHDMIKTGVVCA